jgi:hypothetical protein
MRRRKVGQANGWNAIFNPSFMLIGFQPVDDAAEVSTSIEPIRLSRSSGRANKWTASSNSLGGTGSRYARLSMALAMRLINSGVEICSLSAIK